MGAADLWLVVEGRDHDRPHYERLLSALPATSDLRISIRLAEQIDLDGVTGGGKSHALALHDFWEASSELVQQTRSGNRWIAFALDRDRDDFAGLTRESNHIFYTVGVDVESDVLNHIDIWRAMRSTYGVASDACDTIRSAVGDPRESLLTLWNEWLRLGLLAVSCDARHLARFEQYSAVNLNQWGAVDDDEVERIRAEICSAVPGSIETLRDRIDNHVAQHGRKLLKGRWVARYLWHLVQTHLGGEIVRVNVQAHVLIDTGLEVLDYTDAWAKDYQTGFERLLAA